MSSGFPVLKSFLVNSSDPLSEFQKMQNAMDNLFDEFFCTFNQAPNISVVSGNYPKINILDKNDSFEIVAATSGLSKEDLSVSFKEGVLSIRGESKQESSDVKYLHRELKKSNFLRSFRVDESYVDVSKITSSYENGELRVVIPKKEKDKEKSFKIEIS